MSNDRNMFFFEMFESERHCQLVYRIKAHVYGAIAQSVVIIDCGAMLVMFTVVYLKMVTIN